MTTRETSRSFRPGARVTAAVLLLASVTSLVVVDSASAADPRPWTDTRASTLADAERRAPRMVDFDVFGDSIVRGYGLTAPRTWVSRLTRGLNRESGSPNVRMFNHAVDGQSIATPSFLVAEGAPSTLLEHVRSFVEEPERATPLTHRRFVLIPSVNELVVSAEGYSGDARVDTAERGLRDAVDVLVENGIPREHVIVLPMPPIGRGFAVEFDRMAKVDQGLASMIVELNARVRDLSRIDDYGTLDPDHDGIADDRFFDDLQRPSGDVAADFIHLDVDGHRAIADSIPRLD